MKRLGLKGNRRVATYAARLATASLPLIQVRIEQATISDLLYAVSLFFWFRELGKEKSEMRVFARILQATVSLTSLMLISTSYFTQDAQGNALGILKFAFAFSVTGFVTYLSVARARDFGPLVLSFACGTSIAGLSAALGFGLTFSAGDFTRLAGLAGNPVGLATSAGISLASLVHFHTVGNSQLLIKPALIALNLLAIVWSIGITGLVVAVVGVFVGFFFTRDFRELQKKLLTFSLGILVVSLLVLTSNLGSQLGSRIATTLNPGTSSTSYQGELSGSTLDTRIVTWRQGIEKILLHPIAGNGFDEQGQLAIGTLPTHNFLILSWQCGGLLGFVASLTLISFAVLALLKILKHSRWQAQSASIAALASASLLSAMTGPQLYGRGFFFEIFLVIGFAKLLDIRAIGEREEGLI